MITIGIVNRNKFFSVREGLPLLRPLHDTQQLLYPGRGSSAEIANALQENAYELFEISLWLSQFRQLALLASAPGLILGGEIAQIASYVNYLVRI